MNNKLTILDVPDSVITILNGAFYRNKIVRLKLSKNIVYIGSGKGEMSINGVFEQN